MFDLLLEVKSAAGTLYAVTDRIVSAEIERLVDDIGRLRVSLPVNDPFLASATIGRELHLKAEIMSR